MSDATRLRDGVYVLGPVGIWPFKYRIRLLKFSESEDADWDVSLQRGRNVWATKASMTLYPTENAHEYTDYTQRGREN